MTSEQRISAFIQLGIEIRNTFHSDTDQNNIRQQQLLQLSERMHHSNGWFTFENTQLALLGIANMLEESTIRPWWNAIEHEFPTEKLHSVGVIMAGNIPAVGFHDFLCILLSGNCVSAKLSSEDLVLIPALAAMLCAIEPEFTSRINFTQERLPKIDAIIATGSNNSSRYFEYYFSKYPNIIRKNRTSVAVLTGNESPTELSALGQDIFRYFGLGCRNVSFLYVPNDFKPDTFYEAIEGWNVLSLHKKYLNNYEYSKAIYLVNAVPHFDNNFLLLREDDSLHSPLAVIHFKRYADVDALKMELDAKQDQIQCIVASPLTGLSNIDFGNSQNPGPADYADQIDTMKFLANLP
jgi:hypothetical protein